MPYRHSSILSTLLAIVGSFAALGLGIYQWLELYRMRVTGILPTCTLSEQIDCARIWDSPLSIWLQSTTSIPFPAWGVAWGLLCLALAIQSRFSYEAALVARHWLGLRIVTTVGSAITLGLLAYSYHLGVMCPACIAFYFAVWIVTFAAWRQSLIVSAVLRHALAETGFIAVIIGVMVWLLSDETPLPLHNMIPARQSVSSPLAPLPDVSARIQSLLDNAQPELKQALSDTLQLYRHAPTLTPSQLTPRITAGHAQAPVRIVEWVDLLCPHCKNLHASFKEIVQDIPPEQWRLETRYYPLDASCNPHMTRSDGTGVRCLAAKVLICLTGDPREPDIRSGIFSQQEQLTRDKIWDIATQDQPERRAALDKCVSDKQVDAALLADIEAAQAFGIQGTPLVVVNDRVAPALPVLLYVLMLTQGNPDHPALSSLPTP